MAVTKPKSKVDLGTAPRRGKLVKLTPRERELGWFFLSKRMPRIFAGVNGRWVFLGGEKNSYGMFLLLVC